MSTVQETPQAEERWLDCRIDEGMFSDEMAVTYPAEGTWQKSVFVDRNAVMGDAGGRGKVRVVVLRKNNAIMAVLPSPERDIVYVSPADLGER